jgi:hypothetical protein
MVSVGSRDDKREDKLDSRSNSGSEITEWFDMVARLDDRSEGSDSKGG